MGFFYNPNIHPKEEHDLRYLDVKRSCEMLEIPLILGEYDTKPFFDQTIGQEDEPEKGERCVTCFDIRLVRSAIEAQKLGEIDFTSTLLSSPMKEQEVLYQKGDEIAQKYGLYFYKINVRKNGGVNRQNALAKKDNLYRQNYCGCVFALDKQRANQGKISLELLSPISSSNALGSINERKNTFLKRNKIEARSDNLSSPYILIQRNFMIYRTLHALLKGQSGAIHSYILSNSSSKKAKIKEISWVKPVLDFTFFTREGERADLELLQKYENSDYKFGFCSRDDSVFVELGFINLCLKTNFKNILELCKNPLNLSDELLLRELICTTASINPIIVVDCIFDAPCELYINAIFQEEKLFRVVEITPLKINENDQSYHLCQKV